MPSVVAYHRPTSLDEASELLAEPNRRAIGGGTVAVPEGRLPSAEGVELVDLQALGLDGLAVETDRLVIGAMVRLGDLAGTATPTDPALAADREASLPDLIGELARRELPSTLRNQATVGGTVALGDPDSLLLAGLLVYGAQVTLHGHDDLALAQSLADCVGRRIVTSVSIELDDTTGSTSDGATSMAATGRTPADVPIVAAIGRRIGDDVRVALTGVAGSPVLVDPADPTAGLEPPGDFRGSADYRLHLASTLTARVLGDLS